MIFRNICQIVRKRCQMMKQMRKKAHLEEKYLVLGGFCPKNMVKEQFFCALRGLKILILLNLAQKSLFCHPLPPTGAFGRIFTHGHKRNRQSPYGEINVHRTKEFITNHPCRDTELSHLLLVAVGLRLIAELL